MAIAEADVDAKVIAMTEVVRDMLHQEAMTPTQVIETLCTGPQEATVRRAIWRLLYDEEVIDLGPKLELTLKDEA